MSKSDQITSLWLVILLFTLYVSADTSHNREFNKACIAMRGFLGSVSKPFDVSEMPDFTDESQRVIYVEGVIKDMYSDIDLMNTVTNFIAEAELKYELKDGKYTAGIKEDAALRFVKMKKSLFKLSTVCSPQLRPPDPSEISEEIIYLLDQVRTLD